MNAIFQRAMILQQQGRHGDAERELRQVLAQDPHDAVAHAMLSLCLAEAKKPREATDEADAAIGLSPDLPLAHYARARSLLDRNNLPGAAEAIQEAIRLDSREPDYFALQAVIRLAQRRWSDALASADEGLAIDPEHPGCVNLRAMALVQLGRKQEAGVTIDGALARDPQNAATHANQGWAKLHAGDPRGALEHFRESLRIDPESEWARSGMVEALQARYFVYRWMLRYFLWMSRLSGRAQWGIMVGGWVGYNVLRNVARLNPGVAPLIWPLLIAYIAFALMTWLAAPLFNLLLRLNRFGRYALSREQVITSNLIAVLLLGAAASAIWAFTGDARAGAGATIVCVLLIIPTSAVLRCHPGWPRWSMLGITLALAAIGVSSVVFEVLGRGDDASAWIDRSREFRTLFFLGTLFASFGANYLMTARPQR